MASDYTPLVLGLGAAAITMGTGLVGATAAEWATKAFERTEQKLRARLRQEVFGSEMGTETTTIETKPSTTASIDGDAPAHADKAHETETADVKDRNPQTGAGHREPPAPTTYDKRFGLLLVDYYAYGLTQARKSFSVSMACSVLGGLVLISGVALAIFRADIDGELYASVVTSVAGVLTTSIGVLFHQQANRALKHMEDQTNKLRQDMKAERDAGTALDLLERVADDRLRGRLQAALILKFSGATLPDTDASGYPVHVHDGLNGERPISVPRSTGADMTG
jgi:hypothetical protein